MDCSKVTHSFLEVAELTTLEENLIPKPGPPVPPSKNLKPKLPPPKTNTNNGANPSFGPKKASKSMPPLPPGKDLKPKPPPKPKRTSLPQSNPTK